MPDSATPATAHPAPWQVACLCAAWCRTCDGYREVLAEASRAYPQARFIWVDIEDHADALDDPDGAAADIETFPTLLLTQGDVPRFYGTVMPQPGVLRRLLAQAHAGELPPLASPVARRMAQAVAVLAARDLADLRIG